MYIAAQNFRGANGMVRKGDEVFEPTSGHLAKGLVIEVKIVKSEVIKETVKNVDESSTKRSRKSRNKPRAS
jgi:hypothetical protein